jgi:hypothetical protein
MALTKVTKHIIYGSTLIGHYGHDINDKTHAAASWADWGESATYTPQYADSNIEICVTGSANDTSNTGTGKNSSRAAIYVNGNQQYTQYVIGVGATYQGTHFYHNPAYNQFNARQEFHASNFSTSLYMNCIYAPGNTNAQVVQVQVYSDPSHTINYRDGYVTITELSGPGHNLT